MNGLTKEHNWQNATIMAMASMTAYKNLGAFQKQFDPEAVLFDVDGTQVYCWNDGAIACVAFRGTEPTQWSDIKADLKIRRVKLEYLVDFLLPIDIMLCDLHLPY